MRANATSSVGEPHYRVTATHCYPHISHMGLAMQDRHNCERVFYRINQELETAQGRVLVHRKNAKCLCAFCAHASLRVVCDFSEDEVRSAVTIARRCQGKSIVSFVGAGKSLHTWLEMVLLARHP